jgi:hypothetical protein
MEYPRIILGVASNILFGARSTFSPDNDIPSLAGKVILVTGGKLRPLSDQTTD